MEMQFGEKNIVAVTVKTVEISGNLLADEHHTWINGKKVAIATTVTHGVVLGAEVSPGFSKEELKDCRDNLTFKFSASVDEGICQALGW